MILKRTRILNKLILLNVLILAIIISSELIAGAWVQDKYGGFYQIGGQFINTNKFYDEHGVKQSMPNFSDITFNFYGEFGLSSQVTIFTNIPFYRTLSVDALAGNVKGGQTMGGKKSGVSDSDIGVKVQTLKINQSTFSAAFQLGLPFGEENEPNGLWTGSGEWNQMVFILFGHSFYPNNIYLTGELGFNNRTNGYSDELRYSIEGGYSTGSFLFILRVFGVHPLRNGDNKQRGGVAGLYTNNQRYLAYGPEIIYYINDTFGINARFESAAFVQNAPSAIAFKFGIFITR